MSPKVAKDSHEGRNSNIKNIYIQKINSLMKISKDTIGKSEIEALNQTNRKKIKKNLSETEKNNIRLEKNRQSAKKARERKKIYVKLLEQQEKSLKEVLQQTEHVEKMSEEYVQQLAFKKKQLTHSESHRKRKGSESNGEKLTVKLQGREVLNLEAKKQVSHQKLEEKLTLLKEIVEELRELSKYAYWKENRAEGTVDQKVPQSITEEEFFNIEEVLADIEVVKMKVNENFDLNLDDLFNMQGEEEGNEDQRQNFDIKSLITDQYETVSRCLHELDSINKEAQNLLRTATFIKGQGPHSEEFKNPSLVEFRRKNTIVPEYQIKKIKPRRIDSFNSLSSTNRSVLGKNRSLFTLNNYFINMEEAERKILTIDRAIEEIGRILAFGDQEDKEEEFQSTQKI